MPQLTVRLNDEDFKLLNKLLERTLGKDQIASGTMSDNFRLFINKLGSLRSEKTVSKAISKHTSKAARRCYLKNNKQVSVVYVCSKCSPSDSELCPHVQRESGVEKITLPSSGLPFKGAIR